MCGCSAHKDLVDPAPEFLELNRVANRARFVPYTIVLQPRIESVGLPYTITDTVIRDYLREQFSIIRIATTIR